MCVIQAQYLLADTYGIDLFAAFVYVCDEVF